MCLSRTHAWGKVRRNAVIHCGGLFQVNDDEIRKESVLGGQKWVIIGPVDGSLAE